MSDLTPPSGAARLDAVVQRAARPARWLARVLGLAAVVALGCAVLLWWFGFRDDLSDGETGVLESVVAAAIVLAPGGWLLLARRSLRELADLPGTMGGLARRGAEHLGRRPPPVLTPAAPTPAPAGRPARSAASAARSVYGAVRDAGDLLAGRALLIQLATVHFWLFTLFALLAVPFLALFALIAAIADLAQ